MDEKEEVLFILANDKLSYVDRIIQAERLLRGAGFDPEKTARHLGVPVLMVESPPEPLPDFDTPEAERPPVSRYLQEFRSCYRQVTGLEYDQTPMDMGQLKNIRKNCTMPAFKRYLAFLVDCKGKVTKKDDFETFCILEGMTPAKIYRRLNHLKQKVSEASIGSAGFGYDFIKKQGAKK